MRILVLLNFSDKEVRGLEKEWEGPNTEGSVCYINEQGMLGGKPSVSVNRVIYSGSTAL